MRSGKDVYIGSPVSDGQRRQALLWTEEAVSCVTTRFEFQDAHFRGDIRSYVAARNLLMQFAAGNTRSVFNLRMTPAWPMSAGSLYVLLWLSAPAYHCNETEGNGSRPLAAESVRGISADRFATAIWKCYRREYLLWQLGL